MSTTTTRPTSLIERNGSHAPPAEPPAPPSPPPTAMDDLNEFRWWILLGLITAAIMEILDTTIVNVALPQMAGNLGATNQEIGWVSTGYILSNVVVLPMTAFLTARFGRKRYLTFSILLFMTASFFCGTSHSLVELVFWRILQGGGGAALLSTAQATLRQIFPQKEQGLVQSVFLMGVIVAPTLGPTLGGWITDNYTWSWCFFINMPIGVASVFLVTTFLHDPPGARQTGSIDWTGIGLLAVGLGSLQYVLEEGQENDWFQDAWILRLAILAGLCIAALLIWELSPHNKHPVVDFRILKNKVLASSIFLFIALGFGLYGGIFIFPLFTQTILGFTPTQTGLSLLPGGLATAFSALLCGRLLNLPKRSFDPRALILFGVSIFAVSMWMLGHLTTQSGTNDTNFALFIRGLGLGFLFTPINQVAYASLKRSEAQQASGLINLGRQLGGSLGIAILATFIQNTSVVHRTDLLTNYYSGNPALIARQNALAGTLVTHGYSHAVAQTAALGILNQTLQRQALTQSYNDAFLMILTVFLCVTPAVFLLQKPKPQAAPVAAEAH